MDCCVVAAAIRMRITPRVRYYTAVHNRVYAQIAAGTRAPDGMRVELSSKSQEKLGNVFETLAGVWFVQGNHRPLRRLILFLVTIVYRQDLRPIDVADRALARLIQHRKRQKLPLLISEQFQPSGGS